MNHSETCTCDNIQGKEMLVITIKSFFSNKKPSYLLFREKTIGIFCIGVYAYVRKYLFVYSVEEGVPKEHTYTGDMSMQIQSFSL